MRKWLLKQFEWYRGLILRLKTRRGFLFYKDKDMQLYEKYVTETVDENTGRLTKIDFHIPDDFNFGWISGAKTPPIKPRFCGLANITKKKRSLFRT